MAAIGITNQRETLVAFDRSTGRPLHRAIVWQDRRTAALCAELVDGGHLPLVRATTGLVLDPYFAATKAAWLLRQGGLRWRPRTRTSPSARSTPGCCGTSPADGRRRHYATDPSNASRTLLLRHGRRSPGPPSCATSSGSPRHPARGAPLGRALRHRRAGDLGPAAGVLDGVPVSGCPATSRPRCSARPASSPGMVKVTYGTGSFVLANAGPTARAPPDGLVDHACAWDLGGHGGAGRGRVAYALEGSAFVSGAAIQWLRDGLGIIASAAEVGPLAASVPDSGGVTVVPALTGLGSPWWDPRRPGHHHRHHPGRRPGPARPGRAWRPWPSRCAT